VHYGGLDGTLALEDLSFKVAEGEAVGIVGPSGCGKSTPMRLMSGLWLPTDGSVIIDRREVDRPLSSRAAPPPGRRAAPAI
jgi:NitT/TauT family transport system ATP-binding protein